MEIIPFMMRLHFNEWKIKWRYPYYIKWTLYLHFVNCYVIGRHGLNNMEDYTPTLHNEVLI